MENEDRDMVYKLELLFPELPNTRMIKFSYREDGSLLMRMSEMPNHKIADVYLDDMTLTNPALSFILGLFEKRVGENIVTKKLREAFAPELVGARVGCENYTEIMDKEREVNKANTKNAKLIDAVVKKLFHDAEAEERGVEVEDHAKSSFKAFIDDVVERIRAKFPKKEKKSEALPESAESVQSEV